MENSVELFQQDEEFQDDLLDFQEYRQNKIVEEVMNYKHQVKDDIDYIKSKSDPKFIAENKQDKISDKQKQIRQLRLLNARKYFQTIKFMYLQHIIQSLQTIKIYKSQQQKTVAIWLSMLTPQLLSRFIHFTQTKTLSINISQFIRFTRQAKQFIVKQYGKQKCKLIDWSLLFWSICEELKLACRKIYFFDIDGMVEEVFFKLKYLTSSLQRKKQNRKIKQRQIIKIKIEQQIQQNLQAEDTKKYLFLQDFQFDQVNFKNRNSTSSHTQDSAQNFQEKRENNFLRKKNYKNNYYQLYDTLEDKWVFVNSQILQLQQVQNIKKVVLQGKFIVGFYSARVLHYIPQYFELFSLRSLKDIVIEDLTMFFYDNQKQLSSRRKRIGLKPIMRQIFTKGSFQKYTFMLQNYDAHVYAHNDKIELQYQMSFFPKTKQQMLMSQYFIIPSMLPRYSILDPRAVPINMEFHQQKVYLKRDMIAVTSKNGWVDRGRKVKQNQMPVKKTQNKSKNMTQLFLYEQTVPFYLSFDRATGNLISDDEYNNIYVPPEFIPPEQYTIIDKKISYVCSRAKIQHVQLVQGFNHTMGRILPNYIGYLVNKKDQEEILLLQAERQLKMQQSKTKNRQKQLIALWNKVFKKIELSEWSRSFQQK